MAEGGGRGEVWRTSDALSIQRHVGLGHCGGQQPTAKNDRARFFLLNIQIGTHFVNLRPRVYHTSRVFENVNREEVGRNTVTGLQGKSTSNSGDGSLRFASRRRPGVLLTTPLTHQSDRVKQRHPDTDKHTGLSSTINSGILGEDLIP